MFRIIKDEGFDIWFIHKKFLFWWIKWSIGYHNTAYSLKSVHLVLKKGSYNFNRGEHANFFFIMDNKRYTEEFYETHNEFFEKNAEHFI